MERLPANAWPTWYLALGFTALYVVIGSPILLSIETPNVIRALSIPLAAALIALSTIDTQSLRLPDAITIPLIVVGPVVAFFLGWDSPLWHIGAAAIGFGSLYVLSVGYFKLRNRAGLGLGDAKLFGAAGAWLGIQSLPSVLLWGAGTAITLICVYALVHRSVKLSSAIPFGPFLALGFWIVWLYGPIV